MSQYTDGLTTQQRATLFNGPNSGTISPKLGTIDKCPHCARAMKIMRQSLEEFGYQERALSEGLDLAGEIERRCGQEPK
jgi:hypothetical protein